MRFAAVFALVFLAAACGRKAEAPAPESPAEAANAAKVTWSDELPLADGVATGVTFWDHPTLPFNGMLVVTSEKGVVAYNMEDGNPVARIDGYKAEGAAVGYLGLGRDAVGFLTFFDKAENTFRFFGVDNASRNFLPLAPGPVIRGAVRGFCIGRAAGDPAPSLFVVQKARLQIFNLAPNENGVVVDGEASVDTPDNLVSCAVGQDGVLALAAADGAIYRLSGENAFETPMAKAPVAAAGDISYIVSRSADETSGAPDELLVLADRANSTLHIFNGGDGAFLSTITFDTADMAESRNASETFGATGGNLGALYRNGAVALGVRNGPDGPVVRLAPASSIYNALSLPLGEPVSPRGEKPVDNDNGLIIPTSYQPE